MQRWVTGMPYGLRDFGDAYMGGPYKGKNAYANLEYDAASRLVSFDPGHRQLPFLKPRAYGYLAEDAATVTITLEAMGEGFHQAVLYYPGGSPAAAVRRFIDFEDPGRYLLELTAEVAGPRQAWSLELHDVKVVSVNGLLPYWAAAPEELFNPEHGTRRVE
jgi:hypothetical protein